MKYDRMYRLGEQILLVAPDEDCENPREHTNVSVMWFFHGRHSNLGDKKDVKSEDFDGWEEMAEHLRTEEGALHIAPVFMYEHSGRSLSLGAFGDRWDSGQLGLMWTTKEKLAETVGEDATDEQIMKAYEAELEEYNRWIEGDCWWYRLVSPPPGFDPEAAGMSIDYDKWTEEDTCGGFLGYDDKESGLLDNAFGKDAKDAVEVTVKQRW